MLVEPCLINEVANVREDDGAFVLACPQNCPDGFDELTCRDVPVAQDVQASQDLTEIIDRTRGELIVIKETFRKAERLEDIGRILPSYDTRFRC